MRKLVANFPPLEESRVAPMLENYRLLFDQIGAERFAAAVQRVIFESGLRYAPGRSRLVTSSRMHPYWEPYGQTTRRWKCLG
jgi:hypothetical protein